jgi:hypothetical protein
MKFLLNKKNTVSGKRKFDIRIRTYPKVITQEFADSLVGQEATFVLPIDVCSFINEYNNISVNEDDFCPTIESPTETTIVTPELLEDIKKYHLKPGLKFINSVLKFMDNYAKRKENNPFKILK